MRFDDHFKTFQNKLRNLDKQQLIIMASQKLHEIEGLSHAEMRGAYPWYILLLIRWAIEYENKYKYYPEDVDYRTFSRLVNRIHEMEGVAHKIFFQEGDVYGVEKFLRTIAFQQFWLQNNRGNWDIARQILLLDGLSDAHPIVQFFCQHTGISVSDFLILSSMIWVWCTQDRANLAFNPSILFANTNYNQETIDAYFKMFSRTQKEIREYLLNRDKAVKNNLLQFSEPTPFIKYPFLKINDTHLVYSRRVLEEFITSAIYDEVKSTKNSTIINHFADSFEKYVERCLRTAINNLYTEYNLKRSFPNSKVTDFLIPLEQSTVLLEVKAIDVRAIVKVYPGNKILTQELKDSVIKAVIQGYHTAKKISQNSDALDVPCRSNFFLLIVTYRQIYLGPGNFIWKEFLRDAVVPTLERDGLDEQLIKPERIIVLSIEELELLTGILWQEKTTLSEVLESVVKNNATTETTKLLFAQHFEGHVEDNLNLPLLTDVFEKFWADTIYKFRSDE